jgi:Tfp pilus assembly PilM family ATPase
MAQQVMAVEIAGDQVRAAVAVRTWNSFEMVGVIEQQRDDDEPDAGPALVRLLQKTGKPDIVISALPADMVARRLLELPFRDRRKLEQVVPFALEEHLPFPVEDAVVSFVAVGSDGDNTLVIAAFARKDDVRRHVDLLAGAGLDPKTVTLSTLALAQLLSCARNGREASHLLLDIDSDSTSMVLIDARGTPRAIRTLAAGIDHATGAEALSRPAASAILGAVRQTLLAHASDHEQPDLVLAGPGAAVPGIGSRIGEALSLTVRSLDEFEYPAPLTAARREPLRFAACMAMLLAEAPGKRAEVLNFRRGEFAFRGRTSDLAPFRTPGILAIAALCFALVHLGFGVSSNLRSLSALNAQIVAAARPALGPVSASDAQTKLMANVSTMEHKLKMMGGGTGRGSPLDTLLEVSRTIPARIPVQVEDLVVDDSGLKLQGHADSFAAVDQVKRALDNSTYFSNIQVDHAAAGGKSGKVDFRLSATVN